MVELGWAQCNFPTEKGLRLVHELKEYDTAARWLAELFPLDELKDEGEIPDEVVQGRLCEWCNAHPDDTMAHAVFGGLMGDHDIMKYAADHGDPGAMATMLSLSRSSSDEERFQIARATAEKGVGLGTYYLMECFRDGIGCEKDESFAKELLERALDLGYFEAFHYAVANSATDAAQRVKLYVTFYDLYPSGLAAFHAALDEVLSRYAMDKSCGDLIFAVGKQFKGEINVADGRVFGSMDYPNLFGHFLQATEMYEKWCDAAREACVPGSVGARC